MWAIPASYWWFAVEALAFGLIAFELGFRAGRRRGRAGKGKCYHQGGNDPCRDVCPNLLPGQEYGPDGQAQKSKERVE